MMGHVLISPKIHASPFVWNVGHRAFAAWMYSLLWLSRNGRADIFPSTLTREFGATAKNTAALLAEGMWFASGDDIAVPQRVVNAWGHEIHLWKFGPLETSRPHIPEALRIAVYERDGFNCLHCSAVENLTLDHVIPFSKGGPDTFENLQTLCRSCNSRKGARV